MTDKADLRPSQGGNSSELAGQLREARAAALEQFTDYFVRNYPGPDTIIFKPTWHAPRIFGAAYGAILDALTCEASPAPTSRTIDEIGVQLATEEISCGYKHRGTFTLLNQLRNDLLELRAPSPALTAEFFLSQREITGPTMLNVEQLKGLLNEFAAQRTRNEISHSLRIT